MPPTSTVIFPPEDVPQFPEIGGYSAEPRSEVLASVVTDTGAEQVRVRRGELMTFRYRTVPFDIAEQKIMSTFIDLCGRGHVNFTFYEPYMHAFETLLVGLTDGTTSMIIGWRNVTFYSDFLIDGSSMMSPAMELAHDVEFVDPTKEDRVSLLTVTPPPGQEMVFTDCVARKRHICRMLSWNRFLYAGGATQAEEIVEPGGPLFKMVYEFNFWEKG